MMADKWGLSRRDLEEYSEESHRRASAAIIEGRFEKEIEPLNGLTMDETVREGTTVEQMSELDTIFGLSKITAAVSSQTCDGSSAMLIASESAVKKYDLKPRARIHHMSVRAEDPMIMLHMLWLERNWDIRLIKFMHIFVGTQISGSQLHNFLVFQKKI